MHRIITFLVIVFNLFAILLLGACQTLTNVTSSDISVNFTNNELVSSSILSKQTYVKLQSADQRAIIGNINRVLCTDSMMFIIDRNNNKIVSFDYQGKFLNTTLDIIGHAQNEYIHLTDAAIDEDEMLIYLYCDRPYKILILDYDLKVKKSVPLNDLFLEIAIDSEYLYALYPDLNDFTKFDIRCYRKDDLTGKPKILITQDRAIPNTRGMGMTLGKNGKYIYSSLPFDNSIYKISNGNIIQSWNINMSDRWFEYSSSKDLRGSKFFSANGDKNWMIQNIAASDTEMIFNTNKTNVFKLPIDTGECDGFLRFVNESIPFSDSWFTSTSGIYDVSFSIPASLIVNYKKYYQDKMEPLPSNPINPLIESTTEDDNPLIILAKLK